MIDLKEKHSVDENESLRVLKLNEKKYKDDSLALHTDLYQLNMAEVYFDDNIHDRRAVFEVFFRKMPFDNGYAVFAGLDRVIEYIQKFKFSKDDLDYLQNELGYDKNYLEYLENLKFDGNIKSAVEGELVFANEPMLIVDAKLSQAQLIETPILNILNFHTLIATKAARIRKAVDNDQLIDGMTEQSIAEFGTRRAQEFDAALYGTRAAYIGGFNSTSNVRAGKLFGIPVSGTHAHSMVQAYGEEYVAFHKYARRHKNCVFLVDTFNVLESGVPNAIKVAKELGDKINFVGIRLDSGDLCELSKKARKMLDDAGFTKAKIFASNDLDEHAILELKENGAKIDAWGIGTKLITAYDQPALGAVYKLVALEDENGNMVDTIKLSEDPQKATTPGLKQLLRIANLINNKFEKDIIAMENEIVKVDEGLELRNIQQEIFKDGELIYNQPTIHQIREYCMENLKMLKNTNKSINNPEKYPVALTKKCEQNKMKVAQQARCKSQNQ